MIYVLKETWGIVKMEITKEQFLAYKNVQESGITNMMDIKTVVELADLTREQSIDIMGNYGEYSDKYVS